MLIAFVCNQGQAARLSEMTCSLLLLKLFTYIVKSATEQELSLNSIQQKSFKHLSTLKYAEKFPRLNVVKYACELSHIATYKDSEDAHS